MMLSQILSAEARERRKYITKSFVDVILLFIYYSTLVFLYWYYQQVVEENFYSFSLHN
jgi:hypothetical protein